MLVILRTPLTVYPTAFPVNTTIPVLAGGKSHFSISITILALHVKQWEYQERV